MAFSADYLRRKRFHVDTSACTYTMDWGGLLGQSLGVVRAHLYIALGFYNGHMISLIAAMNWLIDEVPKELIEAYVDQAVMEASNIPPSL